MHIFKLPTTLLLLLFTSFCIPAFSQGHKYVRVTERGSGLPLDSFLVDFYRDTTGRHALLASATSDKHGLVRIPAAAKTFNKIHAHEVSDDTLIHYWPAVEKAKQDGSDTINIKVDKVRRKRFVPPVIYFGQDSAQIASFYEEQDLKHAVKLLKEYPEIGFVIFGNSDEHKEHPNAQKLSLQRAQNVRDWLIKKGVTEKRLKVVANADNSILVPCMTTTNCDAADAANRRVDVVSTPLKDLQATKR